MRPMKRLSVEPWIENVEETGTCFQAEPQSWWWTWKVRMIDCSDQLSRDEVFSLTYRSPVWVNVRVSAYFVQVQVKLALKRVLIAMFEFAKCKCNGKLFYGVFMFSLIKKWNLVFMEKLTFIAMLKVFFSTVSSLQDSRRCRFKKETARNYFNFLNWKI